MIRNFKKQQQQQHILNVLKCLFYSVPCNSQANSDSESPISSDSFIFIFIFLLKFFLNHDI